MGAIRKILEDKGVFDLSKKLEFKVVVLDEPDEEGNFKPPLMVSISSTFFQ